jgi:ABC-type transport system involved in cytochrome c biogenesis permease subunit
VYLSCSPVSFVYEKRGKLSFSRYRFIFILYTSICTFTLAGNFGCYFSSWWAARCVCVPLTCLITVKHVGYGYFEYDKSGVFC